MHALMQALKRWWRTARARRRVRARMILPCLVALGLGLAAAGCGERPAKYIFMPAPEAPADTTGGPVGPGGHGEPVGPGR